MDNQQQKPAPAVARQTQQPARVVDNPFRGDTAVAAPQPSPGGSGEQALVQREVAEVQAAMTIAKRFPRKPIDAMDRIINECSRVSLAEASQYEYARGGTKITGPSIRLAEVLARNWGNIDCGVIEVARRQGYSECIAYAWDQETNFRDRKMFVVRHWRDTQSGGYALNDERDIYELIANQGARRKRACILAVIPGDVIEKAVEQCDLTLITKAAVTPERIKSVIASFAEHGVTEAMIEKRIQRRLEAMTPAQLVNLGKVYNSLRDGMSDPGQWFDMGAGEADRPGPQGAEQRLDSLAEKAAGAAQTASAAGPQQEQAAEKPKAKRKPKEEKPAAPAGDAPQQSNGAPTAGQIAAMILKATTIEAVDEALDLARELPEAERAMIQQSAAKKKQSLAPAQQEQEKPAAPAQQRSEAPAGFSGGAKGGLFEDN